MAIGLRGPCNLFGHPTDEHLQDLDMELSQWESFQPKSVTKIVFGHFPISFTACTKTGKRLEKVFSRHSISAYLCGHLHTKFGTNLFKHHIQDPKHGEFWEWEMGDWMQSRVMRIVAVDGGHTSFLDVDLSSLDASSHDTLAGLPTIVVPTYPLDSRTMQRVTLRLSPTYQDSIRALVFSPQPVTSVTAKIFDSATNHLTLIEELKMDLVSKSKDRALHFSAAWNSNKYLDPSAERYLLQIEVLDQQGNRTNSRLRPFSANGMNSQLKSTWGEFFVMGVVLDTVYPYLMWMAFSILLALLLLPKTLLFVLSKGCYNKFASTIVKISFGKRLDMKQFLVFILWALLQSCEDHAMWWCQQLFIVYLIFFPWFWGLALAEDHPAGHMSIRGWTVTGLRKNVHSALGVPDIMVVVLPYLYWVILPLFVLISALSAERSYLELHKVSCQKKQCYATMDAATGSHEHLGSLLSNGYSVEKEHTTSCKLCKRWIRMGLYVCCMAVATLHVCQTGALLRAYGVKALLASPGLAWPVPLFLARAIYWTSACRKSTSQSDNKDI